MMTTKQNEVYRCFLEENPRILIASGAKRAGKTFIMDYIFLHHISRFRDQGLSFILAGATQAAVRRNVLDDLELILGKDLTLDKSNAVEIFGNKVYVFDGSKSDSWKKARGFTAAGAFLNEATALHDTFVKEVISRCSYEGARVFIDTNPENPMHPIKRDYIDQSDQRLSNGQLNIKAFNFTLFDNTLLDPEYIESMIESTPSGMFTDRDIYGRWVSAEGIVYRDFNTIRHIKTKEEIRKLNFIKYIAGVDWGYEHKGAIMVLAQDDTERWYVIEEHADQYQEIDYWVGIAKIIQERYGNIPFYCDSARPEHVDRFKREKIRAMNADKSVLSGIEQVARLFKTDSLFIVDDATETLDELQYYAWNGNTGEPIKMHDDALDAIRYAIYSDYTGKGQVRTIDKRRLGV
ncbi:MAG: PBSX family phage terminase large subunit [Ezakiella sp.]|nr:PBSX family phage terminase large subunit [Ezakiella sp.]